MSNNPIPEPLRRRLSEHRATWAAEVELATMLYAIRAFQRAAEYLANVALASERFRFIAELALPAAEVMRQLDACLAPELAAIRQERYHPAGAYAQAAAWGPRRNPWVPTAAERENLGRVVGYVEVSGVGVNGEGTTGGDL